MALLLCELWAAPYPMAAWSVPAATASLRTLPADEAVFDVPVLPYETAYMRAQMVHGRPLVGGYLARNPDYPLFSGVPVITDFKALEATPDLCAPPLDGLGPGVFGYFGVGALVLHKDTLNAGALARARALAARAGLGAPVVDDPEVVIYRPALTTTLAPWANLDTSAWYAREENAAGGGPLRWMGQRGVIRVGGRRAGPATLRLTLTSFQSPRRIAGDVDGATTKTVTVAAAPTALEIALPAAAGATVITLRALDASGGAAGRGRRRGPTPVERRADGVRAGPLAGPAERYAIIGRCRRTSHLT